MAFSGVELEGFSNPDQCFLQGLSAGMGAGKSLM